MSSEFTDPLKLNNEHTGGIDKQKIKNQLNINRFCVANQQF